MTEVSMASNFPVLDKDRFEASGKLISNLEMKVWLCIHKFYRKLYFLCFIFHSSSYYFCF